MGRAFRGSGEKMPGEFFRHFPMGRTSDFNGARGRRQGHFVAVTKKAARQEKRLLIVIETAV
jgi:hypothetical protein